MPFAPGDRVEFDDAVAAPDGRVTPRVRTGVVEAVEAADAVYPGPPAYGWRTPPEKRRAHKYPAGSVVCRVCPDDGPANRAGGVTCVNVHESRLRGVA